MWGVHEIGFGAFCCWELLGLVSCFFVFWFLVFCSVSCVLFSVVWCRGVLVFGVLVSWLLMCLGVVVFGVLVFAVVVWLFVVVVCCVWVCV